MNTYDAIYENGTLHLAAPLPLPNSTPVKVTIDVPQNEPNASPRGSLDRVYAALEGGGHTGELDLAAKADVAHGGVASDPDGIYEILNRRYKSGHTDTAARNNEHQP